MRGITIAATGRYLPSTVIDNRAFENVVETSDEWIRTRTGIFTRHIADGEPTWYMGALAAKDALQSSGIDPQEIDLILVSSMTPDYDSPSSACLIQRELSVKHAMCVDINCACTGFVYALDMASRYLLCDDIKTVLIVCTETLSRVTNYQDRTTCVLFGDGAGAVVVKKGNDGLFSSFLDADGNGAKYIYCKKREVTQTPFTKGDGTADSLDFNQCRGLVYMDGKEVYKFATKAMPQAVTAACEAAGIEPAALDVIIPHQANVRIVETAAKNLGIDPAKAYVNIARYGNTSSASIPIALDELNKNGKLKKGDKICVVGFGAGLTYGAVVFEW